MPKDQPDTKCASCGVTDADITDEARKMGCGLHTRETVSYPGKHRLGYLTLCSWCWTAVADEIREPERERMSKLIAGIDKAMDELNKAREVR